jgi:hypothetical protein
MDRQGAARMEQRALPRLCANFNWIRHWKKRRGKISAAVRAK